CVTYKHIFDDLSMDGYYIKGRGLFNKQIQKINLQDDFYNILKAMIKMNYFTGNGCIDFKICNGKLLIFEFNTRMGGSLIYFDDLMHDLDDFILMTLEA